MIKSKFEAGYEAGYRAGLRHAQKEMERLRVLRALINELANRNKVANLHPIAYHNSVDAWFRLLVEFK